MRIAIVSVVYKEHILGSLKSVYLFLIIIDIPTLSLFLDASVYTF